MEYKIESNLFKALLVVGLLDALVFILANLFGWRGISELPNWFRFSTVICLAAGIYGLYKMNVHESGGLLIYSLATAGTFAVAILLAVNALPYIGSYVLFLFILIKFVFNLSLILVFWNKREDWEL